MPNDPDIFEAAGFRVPKRSTSPAAEDQDIFEAAGFRVPKRGEARSRVETALPAGAPVGAADTVQVPGGPLSFVDSSGKFIELPHAPAPSVDIGRGFAAEGENLRRSVADAASSSRALMSSGFDDLRGSMSASGVGKIGLGALGLVASPVSGAVNALVEQPVAALGGPEAGSRAGLVAGLVPSGGGTAKVVSRALPGSRSLDALVDAIGPENVPAAIERLKGNPRLAPMDVSPTVQQLTQGLAVQPGRAQNVVSEATKVRTGGAREAVGGAYNELGPPPQALDVLDRIKERAREVGKKEIQPALEKAGPVDVSPVIKAIDSELKPGLQEFAKSGLPLSTRQQELGRLRQKLVTENGETRIDPQRLHEIQSETGTAAYQFAKSPDAAQKQAGAGLRAVNEKLVDAIDAAAGGAYRPARAKFAEAKDVHESFDRGLMVQRNRQGEAGITEDSPAAWERWAKTAKPDELDAARLGALSAIHMKIGSMRNASRAGLNIPEVEFTRDKLGILFGKEKAEKMLAQLRDERDIAATNSALFGNSQTAARLKGEEALKVRDVGGGNPLQSLQYALPVAAEIFGQSQGFPLVGLAGTTAVKGAHLGWQKLAQMSDSARNVAFARAATASGPARDELIGRLAAHPKVIRELEKSRKALTTTLNP